MEGRDDGGKTAKLLLIGKISNVGRLLIGGNRDGETILVGTRYTVIQDSHSSIRQPPLLLSDIVARAYISGPVIIEG